MVKTTTTYNTQKDTPPVERILGQSAQIVDRTPLRINNFIHAERITLRNPQNEWPEEHAKLNLFPIDDGKFYVHILYLRIDELQETAQVLWLEFKPAFFDQYPLDAIAADRPFSFDKVTEQQFSICTQSSSLIDAFEKVQEPTDFTKVMQKTEIAMQLLRRAMECIMLPFTVCPVPACRFLANETEHDKVIMAQAVIKEHLDSPLTIKELSRKVAMNECYLKKGFKALTGKTIHQYTQELRIEKAKQLLHTDGISVSDVANELGYSSISHFSTAFKKATGTKPCELLK